MKMTRVPEGNPSHGPDELLFATEWADGFSPRNGAVFFATDEPKGAVFFRHG